ncbi:MAG: hypothetical protein QOD10_3912 [Mycobacterium sp.]|jgi:hypothetical protein|nr:hypothetical protein [Mycobacterium sp.]
MKDDFLSVRSNPRTDWAQPSSDAVDDLRMVVVFIGPLALPTPKRGSTMR